MRKHEPRPPAGNGPLVRTLGNMLLSAPLATALALGITALNQRAIPPFPLSLQPSSAQAATPVRPVAMGPIVQMARFVPAPIVASPAPAALTPLPSATTSPAPAESNAQSPRAQRHAARTSIRLGRGWHMAVLRDVTVTEGLQLASNHQTLALAGIEPRDATCKRLDGQEESCAVRATTRLELLVRGRTLTCRIYDAPQGETVPAQCRADRIDLAEDLVRNGLARRNDMDIDADLPEGL